MKFLIVLVTIAFQSLLVSSNVLPKQFPPFCSKSVPDYNQCLRTYYEKIKPHLIKGIPAIKFPSLHPLKMKSFVLNNTFEDGAGFSLALKDVEGWGFDKMQYKNNNFDLNTLEGYFTIEIPSFKLRFNYDLLANIFKFKVQNSGFLNAHLKNIVTDYKIKLKIVKKSGVDYYAYDKLSIICKIGDIDVQVNTDQQEYQPAIDSLIELYNQDHQYYLTMMQPILERTIEGFGRSILEYSLSLLPAKELIPE